MGKDKNMHYGLIGTGPVGLTIGAHLVKAGRRLSVFCIEPDKIAALKQGPLVVEGALSTEARLTEIFDNLRDFLASGPRVILIATKSIDSATVLDALKKTELSRSTVFVACQNGLDVERYIVERFGDEHALRMVLHLGCEMRGPARVHVTFSHTHILSDRPGVDSEIIHSIASALTAAGFATETSRDYRSEVFRKAILNASLSTVCALTGNTMKSVLDNPQLKRIVDEIICESIRVAKAEGARIDDGFFDYAMNYFALGGNHKPSMLVDVERGKLTENEDHCGRIHFFATRHGIPDPVTQTVYVLMRQLEEKKAGRS